MNNTDFLNIIKFSFQKFLITGSRSNEKLKILHGAIARDLSERLENKFEVKSLGFGDNKEEKIRGRYIDKNVDIVVVEENRPIAGIGVKFIQQNYAQNSNNYFENMLGETANIRSNNIPYFQIFIIPAKMPCYKNNGDFSKWEEFSLHHIEKYRTLSSDDATMYLHTPDKMLIYMLDIQEMTDGIVHKNDYISYYSNSENLRISTANFNNITFDRGVILNDYEEFIEKVKYRILSI